MRWSAAFESLPDLLAHHIVLTVCALLAGAFIAIPSAIVIARRPKLRRAALGVAGVSQTIPGLALLALMVPLLHGLGAPSFGFLPALLALTLYSILPILQNTVTGLLGVDPGLTEAARGLGMSPRQSLWLLELPLALPVIMAGLRIATVWTVGTATLATPVGQESLGNLIFGGLTTKNWPMILVGVLGAATLAIVLDQALGGIERATANRNRRAALAWLTALALSLGLGILSPRLIAPDTEIAARATQTSTCDPSLLRPLVVGSKSFAESRILSALIRDEAEAAGFQTRAAEGLGSVVAFEALAGGDIGVYVEYTGTIWTTLMERTAPLPRWRINAEVNGWVSGKHGIRSLGALGFENAYALAVTDGTRQKLSLESIPDLRRHAKKLRIGADYEFFHRPEWAALKAAYGLPFAETKSYDAALQYDALAQGDIDVLMAYTSDGRVLHHKLHLLRDPAQAIPPYDAILLLGPKVGGCQELVEPLKRLVGSISVKKMQQANFMVSGPSKATPRAAAAWLKEQIHRPNAP